ncbi:hypothetical protein [Cetobacterium sp.]|uniref:hypothetical protein n=1 Tax=Cetobacterium sp. TaxID=2071632 RepID=UPI003F333EA3
MKKEENIRKVFLTLADAFDRETIENNMELFNKIKSEFENYNLDEKSFIFQKYQMFVIDYAILFKKAMEVPEHKKTWAYQFILNGDLKKFVRNSIDIYEGPCCGGDKESFIIEKYIKAIREDKNYSLHDEYDYGNGLEKAYWSPIIFKDTDEVFELFKLYIKEIRDIAKNETFSKIFNEKINNEVK